jgi:hypothetical protein
MLLAQFNEFWKEKSHTFYNLNLKSNFHSKLEFEFLLNFQWQIFIQNIYVVHLRSKNYNITSIKLDSLKGFQQYQKHDTIFNIDFFEFSITMFFNIQ